MTFCMNVSRFMNLAAIFSLDLESQSNKVGLFFVDKQTFTFLCG